MYGKDISYTFNLLKVEDLDDLQLFTCGNKTLDSHIHNDIIKGSSIVDEDGLYFAFRDLSNEKIIGVVSLAASGIVFAETNYMHILPAIKIDIFAVDKHYQKMPYDLDSETGNDHYYFSDDLLAVIIKHCRETSEQTALVQYIILYADQSAYHFYERNGFQNYEDFMLKENNQEINANIPMYMLI